MIIIQVLALYLFNVLLCDCSKQTSLDIIDRVNEDFNKRILDMKENVEEMLSGSLTKREMKSKAKLGAGGFALFGDNV